MKEIRFTRLGSNSVLGNFQPGDVARCSDAMAEHLVREIAVAEYRAVPAVESAPEPVIKRKRK